MGKKKAKDGRANNGRPFQKQPHEKVTQVYVGVEKYILEKMGRKAIQKLCKEAIKKEYLLYISL